MFRPSFAPDLVEIYFHDAPVDWIPDFSGFEVPDELKTKSYVSWNYNNIIKLVLWAIAIFSIPLILWQWLM